MEDQSMYIIAPMLYLIIIYAQTKYHNQAVFNLRDVNFRI